MLALKTRVFCCILTRSVATLTKATLHHLSYYCTISIVIYYFFLWKLKRSAHERQKEYFESGEWATGQKWADDAPKEDIDPDSVNLISSGACGAFVHGLEDEYMGLYSIISY